MTQNRDTGTRDPAREPRLNLRELKPGERVRLSGEIIAEVVDNPEDGMWIRGRYITVPGSPAMEGTEDQIFAGDVVGRM